VAAVALLVVAVVPPAGAQVVTTDSPSPAERLAATYAPVVVLVAQDGECDRRGEPYEPMDVDAVLGNPQVLLRQVGRADPVMRQGPTAADLHDLGEGFFLDFPGDALDPGCVFERDFRRFTRDHRPTVYAHIARQADDPDRLALQYWLFWYYNDWNNLHEGDWEFIQLLFDASTVEQALAVGPASVGYAQHEGGERVSWNDDRLDREGDRPVVFSSAGSHASYFGQALYLGRSGSEGFGCDDTSGEGVRVDPQVVLLPDAVDDSADPLAWVEFEGRWGERHDGIFNGPTGPKAKDRWTEPIAWHNGLRSSSVVIPAGDAFGGDVTGAFCSVVEFGSNILIRFTASPATILFSLVVLVAVFAFVVRRTDWSATPPLPLRQHRRNGQIVRAAAVLYRRRPLTFLALGAVSLPISLVSDAILGLLRTVVPLLDDVIQLFGDRSSVGVLVAVIIGSVSHAIAFTTVTALVAEWVHARDEGRDVGVADVFRAVGRRAHDLATGFARAAILIGVLALSVIGIPWAIHRLVRYQLFSPVVMIEGCGGREGLARSSRLVTGRWWRTAILVTILQLLVSVIGVAGGLVLLVLATGLPLWAFTTMAAILFSLAVPFAALVVTLLYGDAVAAADAAEPVPVGPMS
jgi:hypothetical protein